MKKYYKYLILLLVLLGVAGSVIYFGRRTSHDLSHSPQPTQEQKTTLILNEGSKTETFDMGSFVGKTALDATQNHAKVEESGTGVNAFVTSIDGVAADSKKHQFWELDANGSETQVGAGSYIIRSGDSILWKISNY